jgi:NDP-sugar pyrophosphorylase family protein
VSESLLYPVVILAGGLATRMRPLTERVPKSLLDVNGEPFVLHQLRLLHREGVRDVVLCVGFLGEMVEQCVGDGSSLGMRVKYSYDGDRLMGTAGAILRALPKVEGPSFFVTYGDSYLPCDWSAVQASFVTQNKTALMTVFHNQGMFDRSNVEFHSGRLIAYSKRAVTERMKHIDYGLGVFRREAFDRVSPDEPSDLAVLYEQLLAEGELGAYEVGSRFYEIGSPQGLDETRAFLASRPESV